MFSPIHTTRHALQVLLLCLLISSLSVSAGASPPALRVGVDSAYPPFAMQDAAGNVSGFDVDIAESLCVSMERDCVLTVQPLDVLLAMAKAGEVDMVLGVSLTPERQVFLDYTDPYFQARSIYMGRPRHMNKTVDQFKNKRIGVRKGSVQEQYLIDRHTNTATIVADTFTMVLDKLIRGELDLVMGNDLACHAFLKSEQGQRFDIVGNPILARDLASVVRIGVKKNDSALCLAVNRALTDIRFSGEFRRINRKYFPYTLY